MGKKSEIQWTDATWNPVTGCSKVSPGCAHCYAEGFAFRGLGRFGHKYAVPSTIVPGTMSRRAFTDVRCHEDALDQPLRWKKPRKIFVNSMSDLFHEDVPNAFIDRVFAVMALAPRHTFQVLTKRAERMRAYLDGDGLVGAISGRSWRIREAGHRMNIPIDDDENFALPLPNVWLGVSVENQRFADERIPLLLQTPAAVRFISAEPLLGAVDLSAAFTCESCGHLWRWHTSGGMCQGTAQGVECYCVMPREPYLDWVIVGGESGVGARPLELAWVRSILEQCQAAAVPVFVKQLGAQPLVPTMSALDVQRANHKAGVEFIVKTDARTQRLYLRDRKGGNPAEWPEDLRVREFPTTGGSR